MRPFRYYFLPFHLLLKKAIIYLHIQGRFDIQEKLIYLNKKLETIIQTSIDFFSTKKRYYNTEDNTRILLNVY